MNAKSSRWVALLRAINVGGNRILPMADLSRIFTDAGASEVKTYIQSGNVVFSASESTIAALPTRVAGSISKKFGFDVPIVIRSAAELRAARDGNPFLADGCETATLHVAFLAELPAASKRLGLNPDRSPGDRFVLAGRDIYLQLANGAAKTKLTNEWFDRTLGTVSTMRNWRTILTLCELFG